MMIILAVDEDECVWQYEVVKRKESSRDKL